MTIKQLLDMPIDKEKSKCGGFQLTVKTARKNRKVDGKTVQQVVLSDSSGEIPGDIFMPNPKQCSYLARGTVINVVVCWLQPGEAGPKLYIDEWFRPKVDAEGNPVYRNDVRGYGDLPPDFCEGNENVPSMCRNSQVREFIGGFTAKTGYLPPCTKENKDLINEWVDFIISGQS
jgi:hypothetical protein